MASNYWIKLYHEMLDDPKMCRLTDRQYRRVVELLLLAGDYEQDGSLPEYCDIEFRLRNPEGLKEDIEILLKCGILSIDNQEGYYITKWKNRQCAMSNKERQSRYRESKHKELYYSNEPVTNCYTDKDIDKIKIESRANPATKAQIAVHKSIEGYFVNVVKMKKPNNKKAYDEWTDGIADILVLTDFDDKRTKELIEMSVKEADKDGLTIVSPKSLVKMIGAIVSSDARKINKKPAGTEFDPSTI